MITLDSRTQEVARKTEVVPNVRVIEQSDLFYIRAPQVNPSR